MDDSQLKVKIYKWMHIDTIFYQFYYVEWSLRQIKYQISIKKLVPLNPMQRIHINRVENPWNYP